MENIKRKIKDKILDLTKWLNNPSNRYSKMFQHFSNERKWLHDLLLEIQDVENQQTEITLFRTEDEEI